MNADKIVKFVEYLGPKEEKKVSGAVFKANPDFGNRKVGIVDRITAETLLRYPKVFREIDVREFIGESVKGGNQGNLLEETKSVQVADDSIQDAMKKDRLARDARIGKKKGKRR